MGDTAITTTKNPPLAEELPQPQAETAELEKVERTPKEKDLPTQALNALASLRFTVVLLALSIFLVFAGTLAQIDQGLWYILQNYFRTLMVWIPFQVFVQFLQIFFGVSKDVVIPGSFPFPGGWILGGLMLLNLTAAHATRFQMTWKRSGILILHFGLIVMLLGELITGLMAVECIMKVEEGKSSSFIEQQSLTGSEYELALVDTTSDPNMDEVFVVPGARVRQGGTISDDKLPVDIEILEYMPNSSMPKRPAPDKKNRATAGDGLELMVEATAKAKDSTDDAPSAYVVFKDKKTGKELGTYLLSRWFSDPMLLTAMSDGAVSILPQKVAVDGKTYEAFLRYKRTYEPFQIHLIDFRFDRYQGTNTAKNYSSLVRLVDPEMGEDREVVIRMNEPLRYRGYAFYQAGFDGRTEKETRLQVVTNPAWLMPYISCILVALGMIVHFGIRLQGFLKARALNVPAPLTTGPSLLPLGLGAIVAVYLTIVLASMGSGEPEGRRAFGKLPVLHDGRVKPMDSFARVKLLGISNRQTLRTPDGQEHSASKWLLDVITGQGDDYQVFRIENFQVLDLLGLKQRDGFRYSYNEIVKEKQPELAREFERVRAKDQKQRDTYEQKIFELGSKLLEYKQISSGFEPKAIPPEADGGQWAASFELLKQAYDEAERRVLEGEKTGKVKFQNDDHRRKVTIDVAFRLLPANAAAYQHVLETYREIRHDGRPEDKDRLREFEKAVADYSASFTHVPQDETARIGTEVFFNSFSPFYHCTILYALVFLLVALSWLFNKPALNSAAFWLAVCTLVVHSVGLVLRMFLMDRWLVFVTNLYSSAIFIGWACLILGLILEGIYRNGFGNVVAAVAGFGTTIVAHNLAIMAAADSGDDTLGNLQAVLDTNFWLATHVTCISIGYAGTFFAGFMATAYLVARVVGVEELKLKTIGQMTYGMLAFAVLFSFVGTVLGGIWADQSWGRFWGWDPKENGALIIVLWNALVLHARWGGLVKARGMCALAIVGNIVTAWSWFGTNQLGVGLHSYGFSNKLAFWLVMFWASQFAALGLAFLPANLRRSPELARGRGH